MAARTKAAPISPGNLRAQDSVTVEASNDAEAIEKAKTAAARLIESRSYPEHINIDERRQGIIAYIDRIAPAGREEIATDIAFDDDRIPAQPLRAQIHDTRSASTRG